MAVGAGIGKRLKALVEGLPEDAAPGRARPTVALRINRGQRVADALVQRAEFGEAQFPGDRLHDDVG